MYELDGIDKRILEELKRNSRLSVRDLSNRTKIPAVTVHRRMKKLVKEKIIEEYTISINNQKLGRDTVAHILIGTKPGANYDSMMKDIIKRPEVEDMAAIAGPYDIILKVRTSGMEELDAFIFDYIRRFPDVTQTQTMMVFRGWKKE